MTAHRFTPEEIDGFLTFLLEGGADKSCSNVYLIITQLRDDLSLHQHNKLAILEKEIENTANEIDQMFRQRHSMKELEHSLMRLVNRLQPKTKAVPPDFESWWETEKTRPPYTNPKAIAKSAWEAARGNLREVFRSAVKPKKES